MCNSTFTGLLIVLGSFSFSLCSQAPLKLELASVVFRHGDRSPVGTFPNDKYNESDWPQGYGQLSVTGMKQHQELGQILRRRYILGTYRDFLSENYTRVQVRVRSTDVDRTLMSASTLLSSLFPADDSSERFNQTILWQPIPIHTVPVQEDELLRGYDDCQKYKQLRQADQQTEEYKQVERENQALFNTLTTSTGVDPVNLSNIWNIEDTVFIEDLFDYLEIKTGLDTVNLSSVKHIWNIIFVENVTVGKEAPAWATPSVITKLRNLSDYTLSLMFNTKEKNRLTAGTWLEKILTDMKNKASQMSSDDSRLFLYSAHDTTVACMLAAFGLFNNKQPPYATAFFIELLSDDIGNYYVKFSLRVGPDSMYINLLEMSQCKNRYNCTLTEFETFVQPLISPDLAKECNDPSPPSAVVVAVSTVSSVAVIGLAIVSIVLGVVCCERKRASTYRRLRMAVDVSKDTV